MKGDNSEIGYLKNLDPQKYAERQAFYAKAFDQMKQGLFGDRFREQVYRIMAGVHQPQSLRLPP